MMYTTATEDNVKKCRNYSTSDAYFYYFKRSI